MFKKRYFQILFILLLVIVIGACATNPFTPKQKITMFMGVYNSQFYDYMTTMGYSKNVSGEWIEIYKPDLSEDQKIVLREKKKILEELHPLVVMYDQIVIKGLIPDRELEYQIIGLLNRLQ